MAGKGKYVWLLLVFVSVSYCYSIEYELETLTRLYHYTRGKSWTVNTNWLVGHPCTNWIRKWTGITCNKYNHVTSIVLPDNNLRGDIPPGLFDFTSLENLDLSNNRLTGEIPRAIKYDHLRTLNLSYNRLTGDIPAALMAIPYLYLSGNQFTDESEPQELEPSAEGAIIEEQLIEIGTPERVVEFLNSKEIVISTDEHEIRNGFESGEYPLRFHDDLLWKAALQSFQSIPEKIKRHSELLPTLKEKELASQNTLKDLEEQQQFLTGKLESVIKQREETEKFLFPWQELKSLKYDQIAERLLKIEKLAADSVKQQFDDDPEEFTALSHENEKYPKLSLLLNAFGITSQSITKLSHLNGYEFMDSNIDALCKKFQINIFGDGKKLAYIQSMMKDGLFYGGKHKEKCPVCRAERPEDLIYLIEEQAKTNEFMNDLDLNVFLDNGINGYTFLALNTQDIQKILPNPDDQRNTFSKTKRHFEKIHRNAD